MRRMGKIRVRRYGFALPTVLIASVVMFIVLAAAVQSVVAVRVALKQQYYEQLAKSAGEAGVAFAQACLSQNGNIPQWTNEKPLQPGTDCEGENALSPNPFRVLIVAGGGSGGGSTGGGGGGGGVVSQNNVALSVGSYPVTVGAGGPASASQTTGVSGQNSSFNGVVATGGGGGGFSSSSGTSGAAGGLSGGSGGGGQVYYGSYGPGNGTAGQGNAGGSIAGVPTGSTTGGGGAGGPGLAATTTNNGGNGGTGIISDITGLAAWYGGGGGGGGNSTTSAGGIGGGGAGAVNGTAGVANTGGGGGGGWLYAGGTGGAGGSGVVIISYPDDGTVTASGGSAIYSQNGYRVHEFRSTGAATFIVSAVSAGSCPTDPRCSVHVEDGLRSTYSVGLPTLDADGRALLIPHNGYVELLRASNGSVWRTYTQPATQSRVVPDLCSGAATAELGWRNAARTTAQDSLPGLDTAITISESDTALNPGVIYFRKDFSVSEAGQYVISGHTPTTSEGIRIYIDGLQQVVTVGAYQESAAFTLQPGCHVITAELFSGQITPLATKRFTAALQKEGADAPLVTTDTSWLVSTGETRHFTDPDYYMNDYWWPKVNDQGVATFWFDARAAIGDGFARKVGPIDSLSAGSSPSASHSYLRDSRDVEVSTNTLVRVTAACDDSCVIYRNGQEILQPNPWGYTFQTTMTLTPGKHRFGAWIYNGAGASGAILSVVRVSDGAVLTRTDSTWRGARLWTASAVPAYYSYSSSFVPTPYEPTRSVTGSVLVVAGGGGGGGTGGGGGGGGVIYSDAYTFTPGSYTVTIGGGGAGTGASASMGTTGSNTVFGSLTAVGGGGGATHMYAGRVGGSSGGSGMTDTGSPNAATSAYNSGEQGNAGGAGVTISGWAGNNGGGGGAGGSGSAGSGTVYGGLGGAGFTSTITGIPVIYAAGGAAGEVNGSFAAIADPGAGQSALNAAGSAAYANTGSGGGGGSYNGSYLGGGAGGSGIVVVRYKTGTVVATGGTVTTWNGYTIHRFTSNGTFTVTSVQNP